MSSSPLPVSVGAPAADSLTTGARTRVRSLLKRAAVVAVCLSVVALLLALEVVATFNHYTMRVISDTPTFIALIRDLAARPMHPVSVFFASPNTTSVHATPYLQMLAWVWKLVAPASRRNSAVAIGTFLSVVGIPVTLFVLGTVWLYVRRLAGVTAAFVSLPVLLVLFGPANIVFSSDLTINGFLAAGYYPTTLAAGLTLTGLLAITQSGWKASCLAALLVALTVTTDLFSGTVMVAVLILYSVVACHTRRTEAWRVPAIIAGGFLLAQLWPLFNVWSSFASAKLPVPGFVCVAVVAPQVSMRLGPWLGRRAARAVRLLQRPIGARAEERVANLARCLACGLCLWALSDLQSWPSNPALHSYRLGMYWDNAVWRWAFLLLPGLIGLVGLVRLARGGRGELLLWLAGMYAIGVLGSVWFLATGHQLPLYYRFYLACQIPLAVGVAAFLTHHRSSRARNLTVQLLLLVFCFKVGTLLIEPTDINYFGSPLPTAWNFGAVIPANSGIVASDPATSYYIPATTGNRVLTLSGHADSGAEPHIADAGYLEMHRLFTGSASQFGQTISAMYRRGVRWVVVEKFTSLRPATRELLFATPTSGFISRGDIPLMARYMSRLQHVGIQVYDDEEYTVYRLDRDMLRRAVSGDETLSPGAASQVVSTLKNLVRSPAEGTAPPAQRLYRLGIRQLTIGYGAFGAPPELIASGDALAAGDVVSTQIEARDLVCSTICSGQRSLRWIYAMGRAVHDDGRFLTILRLSAPITRRSDR